MDRIRVVAAAVGALGLLVSCRSTPPSAPGVASGDRYDHVRREVAALVQKEMAGAQLVGVALSLVDDQEVVWAQGFGYADREAGTLATETAVFSAGSVSKLFTAVAVMKLAEQGRIDIDKPLASYLPEFSVRTRYAHAPPVTVRSLLTHHSGLAADLLVLWDQSSRGRSLWLSEPLELLKDEYLVSPPGSMFSYSNVGYGLLGTLIERVSGMPFESYMAKEVLAPLGMTTAAFAMRPDIDPITARGYRAGKAAPDMFFDSHPAGGLRASALDMSAFIRFVLAGGTTPGGGLVSAGTLQEMLRRQNAGVAMDLDFRIGLGFWLEEVGGFPAVGHNGDTRRFHSCLLALPDQKLGVYVVSNSSESKRSVERIARRTLELALEAKTGNPVAKPAATASGNPSIAATDLTELPGFYATELGLITVTARNGEVWSRLEGNDLKLLPRPQNRFAMQFRLLGLIPIRVPSLDTLELAFPRVGGRSLVVAYVGGNAAVLGEKVSPVPIPAAWSERVGSWKAVNTDGVGDILRGVSIHREGEFLVFETDRREVGVSARPLTPLDDREAVTSGTGRGMGETIRVKMVGSEERLMYSGYELARVPR
jgi:CubicO group peptidase (beta-lactamase class C family)